MAVVWAVVLFCVDFAPFLLSGIFSSGLMATVNLSLD